MRHKKKRVLELSTGVQKKQNVVRNLLTSLITHGEMITTGKRAKVVKAEADKFFARLVRIYSKFEGVAAKREADRFVKSVLYTEVAGKRAVSEILPKYLDESRTTGFVSNYKLGFRAGDAAEKVLVKLV